MAEAFIQNPNNLECVNHINENKKDNRASNLEWCTRKYNCNYGTRNERVSKGNSIYKIMQKSLDNKVIKIWDTIWDLKKETTYKDEVIRICCNDKNKTAYGYKWEYIQK